MDDRKRLTTVDNQNIPYYIDLSSTFTLEHPFPYDLPTAHLTGSAAVLRPQPAHQILLIRYQPVSDSALRPWPVPDLLNHHYISVRRGRNIVDQQSLELGKILNILPDKSTSVTTAYQRLERIN